MEYGSFNQIQGSSTQHTGKYDYMKFQNLIEEKAGVQCSVIVRPNCISIRTKDYADYVIAKSVIKGRTGAEIVRAEP